jgi:hypothetical protein
MSNSPEAIQADQAKIQELRTKKLNEQVTMRRVAERAKNLQVDRKTLQEMHLS